MPQFGLFDYQKQLSLLEKAGDPLIELNRMIDWEQFRSTIERARENQENPQLVQRDMMLFYSSRY